MEALQAMMNGMSAEWQRERAETQMTLGGLIDRLAAMPPETMIDGFNEAHSYRGYYTDLAFERTGEKTTAREALQVCRECMGEVFVGYKGGNYCMGRDTPVWISNYGRTGDKFMAVNDDGTLETKADD